MPRKHLGVADPLQRALVRPAAWDRVAPLLRAEAEISRWTNGIQLRIVVFVFLIPIDLRSKLNVVPMSQQLNFSLYARLLNWFVGSPHWPQHRAATDD